MTLFITVSQGDRASDAKPILAITSPGVVAAMLRAMTDHLLDELDGQTLARAMRLLRPEEEKE